MAAEKNFENKVKQFLKESGCWFLKYWGGAAYTKSGVPDLLVCCKGRFIGVELKAPNGKPSDLQIYNLRGIDRAGGLAVLLYPKDYDLFKRLVDDPQLEMERLKKQREEAQKEMIAQYDPFGQQKQTGQESGNDPPDNQGGDVNGK